ncbi:MAG: zinc ribbon domain-containing protein [Candidatus Peregrinibacteria bacterium]|nr:zinc ribbon domain-containing protein [Candidatus Peregrinibacteria bacterium]
MPTFDFQCGKCKNVFPFSRPFGSKTKPACPKCKSKRTEKLIAPPAIHFRGQGFYRTDSATASSTPPKKEAPKEKAKPKEETKQPPPPPPEKKAD